MMIEASTVKSKDLEELAKAKRLPGGQESTIGNVEIKGNIVSEICDDGMTCTRRQLVLKSTGGTLFRTPVIQQFVTVCKHSRPDLFPQEIGYATCHTYAYPKGTPEFVAPTESLLIDDRTESETDHTYCTYVSTKKDNMKVDNASELVKRRGNRKKRIIGMMENEENLLHLLDQRVVSDILDDFDTCILDEDATSTELLGHVLVNEKCQLLPDIVKQLQYYDGRKWAGTSVEELYPAILTDGKELMKSCTVKEIAIISKVLEQHTDRFWFATGGLKGSHINTIVRGFGGNSLVAEESTRRSGKNFNPLTLSVMAKKVLLSEEYDVDKLHISLGTVMAREMRAEWFRHCTVDNNIVIPLAEHGGVDVMEIFTYPEKNDKQEVMWRTFDYTHILTNMCSHILTRGYDYCRKEDFEWVVDNTTGVLSQYMVEYNMDSQNAFSALKLFGEEV